MRKYTGNSIRMKTSCSRTDNSVFLHFNLYMKQNGIDCIDMNMETDLCRKVENDRKEYQRCLQERTVFRDEYGQEIDLDPKLYHIDMVSCESSKGSVILLRNTKNNGKTMAVRCEEYGLNKDGKASCVANIGVGGCSQFNREIKKLPKG